MRQPLTASLATALPALRSSQSLIALLDELVDLSDKSIRDLAPLIFDVVQMENQYLGRKALKWVTRVRPEWLNHKNAKSCTPLMEAVKLNRLDQVDILMAAGAKTTPRNKAGMGVLDVAAHLDANHRWQAAMGAALLEKGRFTHIQKDRALYYAAVESNLGMSLVLLAHGARIASLPQLGSALVAASLNPDADNPSADIVRAMLQTDEGQRIIDQDWGVSPLGSAVHCAASTGNLETLGVLIAAGAAVNPPGINHDPLPLTPLMSAANGLHPDAIALLIKSGADATLLDATGSNALHYLANAISNQGPDDEAPLLLRSFELLSAAGADPLQENEHGHTPARTALNACRPELSAALGALASSRRMALATAAPDQDSATAGPRL